MATKLVKCASCNVVINEVLAFICNKIDVMNEQSISQICASAFDETEILVAKNLLFDSISTTKRKKARKRQGKTLRDIDDIICLLKETDPEEIPTFVARDLHKLPPVLFDHVDVTRLLKDLLIMKCELERFSNEYTTVNQFRELQLEVEALKNASIVNNFAQNVTLRRGGSTRLSSFECESGPSALPPQQNIFTDEGGTTKTSRVGAARRPLDTGFALSFDAATVSHQAPPLSDTNDAQHTASPNVERKCKGTESPIVQQLTPPTPTPKRSLVMITHPKSPRVVITERNTGIPKQLISQQNSGKRFSEILQEGEWKSQQQNEEWTLIQRKRLRNRFVGKPGTASVGIDSKFKAADNKMPLYIYNVSKNTSVCDIITYIKNKTNVDIQLEKMNMKSTKDYAAYKVFVPKHKMNIFLSDDLWPDGVLYRRFVDFTQRTGRHTYRDMDIKT